MTKRMGILTSGVDCGMLRTPKAPPTNGEITRTLSGEIPSCLATPRWVPITCCVDSQTVSASPLQAQITWNSSIGL